MIKFDYKSTKRQGQIVCDSDVLSMIRNHFSVKNDGASFARWKGKRFVKDRKYAITPTGLFDFGLYGEILKYLTQEQITNIEFTDEFKKRLKCGIKPSRFWNELKFDARYYQKETVEECLKKGMGTAVLGTGAGKSLAQALLIENYIRCMSQNDYRFKCLIIVPGLSLVNQLQQDFEDYGVTFTHSGWTGKEPLQDTEVVICNSENLLSQFDNNPWIRDVHLLICDECHKINSTAGISKIVNKIATQNKFGFTGTLSDKIIDQWKTIGTFGPVIYEKKSKELRDEKFLSDVLVKVLQINHPNQTKKKYKDELEYIYQNEKRNQIIKKLSDTLTGNTLIMVNHLDHGDILYDLLSKSSGKRVFFVKGEMKVTDRSDIVQLMETSDEIICIAMSSIFSTGINIKNLPYIMFAGLGKSFIRVVQSIGRGLRLHDNKNKLVIFDICDNLRYSHAHSVYRQNIYDKEKIPWKKKEI
jgi:superfamily II DNA or RNA helicase